VAIAIIGAGNLGLALADYPGFREDGFSIAALFDAKREKIGHRSRAGVPIHDMRDFRRIVRREQIRIAAIAVPAEAAQTVVNTVVGAGVKAVLNFSPGTLKVPSDVKLKSVDLTVSLESLSFFLAQGHGDEYRKGSGFKGSGFAAGDFETRRSNPQSRVPRLRREPATARPRRSSH
jgi:redox-sensing transcriptional repressor